MIGSTQSSYPALLPSDEDYKTHSLVMAVQRWGKSLEYANCLVVFYPAQSSLSRLRYPIASAKWVDRTFSLPSKSAMVRATFRMRS